jgi:hypothetical protein
METVYIVLHKHGTEWDGQSLYRTQSKALFEFIRGYSRCGVCPYFPDFPDALKEDLRVAYEKQKLQYPETDQPFDDEMSIDEAMEWLDSYGLEYHKFPVILGGTTELISSWNWM